MADQLFLSYRLRGFNAQNMIRYYDKLLRLFPVSRLSAGASVLRINAVSAIEPPLLEKAFESPADLDHVIAAAREFAAADCGLFFDTQWDLWQYTGDWKLAPSRVTIACFGPEFDSGTDDHLRIDFGIDTHFLPQPDLPNYLFMARSNVRSLLHLVHEIDGALAPESRQLWTETGVNFAERLQASLAGYEPNG